MMSTSKSSPANCHEMALEEDDIVDESKGHVTFKISDSIEDDSKGCSQTSVGSDHSSSREMDDGGKDRSLGGPGAQWRHLDTTRDKHVHSPECHWNRHGPLLPCPDCSKPEHECHPGPPSPQLRRPAHAPSDCPCHAPGSGTDPLHCRCQCHVDRAASSPNIDSANYDHLQALRNQYK